MWQSFIIRRLIMKHCIINSWNNARLGRYIARDKLFVFHAVVFCAVTRCIVTMRTVTLRNSILFVRSLR